MKKYAAGILLAILVLLFTTGLGLAVIHITDLPYKLDIDWLKISESTGLSRDEILLNYDAMLLYLSPFSNSDFSLPTLKYSEVGVFHFAQVKIMFNTVYLAGLISGIILTVLVLIKAVSKKILWISGIVTLLIPAIFGFALASNFDRAFNLFHTLFFEGSTWLFNPKVDQIINILPMDFFMHCAYFVAVFWVIAAAVQIVLSYEKRKTV